MLKQGHERVNNSLFKRTMGKTITFVDYTKLLKDCNSSSSGFLGAGKYNIGGMRRTLHPIKRGQRSKHVYLAMFNVLGFLWFSSLFMILLKVMF